MPKRTAEYGRLFSPETWCADTVVPEWLEVDFISTVSVLAVGIQGNPSSENYITTFKLKYRAKTYASDWVWVLDNTYSAEKVSHDFRKQDNIFSFIFFRACIIR